MLSLRPLLFAFATASSLALAPLAQAQTRPHEHAHHPAGNASQLQLDAGKRWPTDESLRQGMAAIRDAFDADHARIHAGQQTNAQYDALAAQVQREVDGIVAQCQLAPDADAQLHLIVADLLQGAGLMRGHDAARTRHDGAALVHGALLVYAKFFDDPAFVKAATPAQGDDHDHEH